MILLFTLRLMVSVAALWLAPVHHYALLAVCFLLWAFVFGPQMLIGLWQWNVDTKLRRVQSPDFSACSPISVRALAGWPLSLVIERYGWSGMFSLLSVAAVLMGLLLMPLLMAGITTTHARRIKQ